MREKKICIVCGKEFEPRVNNQKCCSPECSDVQKVKRAKASYEKHKHQTKKKEKIFGRKRSFKNAPRTLDIDIIDFSAKIRQSERLRLPHPKACQRLSVILPLAMM